MGCDWGAAVARSRENLWRKGRPILADAAVAVLLFATVLFLTDSSVAPQRPLHSASSRDGHGAQQVRHTECSPRRRVCIDVGATRWRRSADRRDGTNISSPPPMLQQPLQPGLWLSRRPAWRPPHLQEGERLPAVSASPPRARSTAAGAPVGGGGRFGRAVVGPLHPEPPSPGKPIAPVWFSTPHTHPHTHPPTFAAAPTLAPRPPPPAATGVQWRHRDHGLQEPGGPLEGHGRGVGRV